MTKKKYYVISVQYENILESISVVRYIKNTVSVELKVKPDVPRTR